MVLGTIQSMKKNVNQKDKKKKKELAEEIVKLEAELDARHKAELTAFLPGKLDLPTSKIPETVVEETIHDTSSCTKNEQDGKMSRARRRREKKEVDEKEKKKRIDAESFVLLENSQMKAEDDAFVKIMNDLNLNIVDVDPDGNWYVHACYLFVS